jgi:hypothetical protein
MPPTLRVADAYARQSSVRNAAFPRPKNQSKGLRIHKQLIWRGKPGDGPICISDKVGGGT